MARWRRSAQSRPSPLLPRPASTPRRRHANLAACMSGLQPQWFRLCTEAPRRSRKPTSSSWPPAAANCNPVLPASSVQSTGTEPGGTPAVALAPPVAQLPDSASCSVVPEVGGGPSNRRRALSQSPWSHARSSSWTPAGTPHSPMLYRPPLLSSSASPAGEEGPAGAPVPPGTGREGRATVASAAAEASRAGEEWQMWESAWWKALSSSGGGTRPPLLRDSCGDLKERHFLYAPSARMLFLVNTYINMHKAKFAMG